MLGTRDYVRKCGFSSVVLGLSGGVDSALTAAIAAEAVGAGPRARRADAVAVFEPGQRGRLARPGRRLGIATLTLPIEPAMKAMDQTLAAAFRGTARDVTEENIQARLRGNLLMALSNKKRRAAADDGQQVGAGRRLLHAVRRHVGRARRDRGRAEDDGLPCRALAERHADGRRRFPSAILTKAPSAELRPNQTDQDSLPPYDVLDAILQRYIEHHEPAETIVAAGFDAATVRRVLGLVGRAEFKRKQAAPGLKVTDRAFGTGWRMPIAAKIELVDNPDAHA